MFDWLLSTKIGQWISRAVTAFGIIFIVFGFGKYKGAQNQKDKELQNENESLKRKDKTHEDVRNMSDAELDSYVDKWVSDDKDDR